MTAWDKVTLNNSKKSQSLKMWSMFLGNLTWCILLQSRELKLKWMKGSMLKYFKGNLNKEEYVVNENSSKDADLKGDQDPNHDQDIVKDNEDDKRTPETSPILSIKPTLMKEMVASPVLETSLALEDDKIKSLTEPSRKNAIIERQGNQIKKIENKFYETESAMLKINQLVNPKTSKANLSPVKSSVKNES